MSIELIDVARPKNDGNFPITEDTDTLGGLRIVADITARDAIQSGRRKEGMVVKVLAGGEYELRGGITNSDWVLTSNFRNRTQEDITITIDPIGGTDPGDALFTNQTQITAHGSVQTINQAMAVLPDEIGHLVTLSLVDGSHTMDNPAYSFGEEFGRFKFMSRNLPSFTLSGIQITSANGLVQTSGTVTMPVTSVVSNVITLTSNPGLAIDFAKGKWIRINGGSLNGRIFPCTANNGTSFTCIRLGSTTCTSIDIVEPAATLTTAGSTFTMRMNSHGMVFAPTFEASVFFDAVQVECTAGSFNQFEIAGQCDIIFHNGTIMKNWYVHQGMGSITRIGEVIFDGGNTSQYAAFYLTDGSYLRAINSNQTWGIMNYNDTACVFVDCFGTASIGAGAFLFGGGFDTFTGCAIVSKGPNSYVQLFDSIEFTNPGPYLMNIDAGGKVLFNQASFVLSKYGVGTSGAFILDNVGYPTFTELTTIPGNMMEGHLGSLIGQVKETASLTSPSLATGYPKMRIYQEGLRLPSVLTPTGTAQTIDWNTGEYQRVDAGSATGDITLTLNNPVEGALYTIEFTQDNATARNLIWPGAVLNGPPVDQTLSSTTLITFRYNGTNYIPIETFVRSTFSLSPGSGAGIDTQGKDVDLSNGVVTGVNTIQGEGSTPFRAGSFRQTAATFTPTGTTQTVNFNNANIINIDLGSATGDVTLTLNNPSNGAVYIFKAYNNGSNRNIIWPSSVKWVGGSGPTITTGAAAIDTFSFYYDGTNFNELSRAQALA